MLGSVLGPSSTSGYEAASVAPQGPALRIAFGDQMVFAQISQVLRGLEGRIVDGPSALGLYRVAFRDEDARDAAFTSLTNAADIATEVVKD